MATQTQGRAPGDAHEDGAIDPVTVEVIRGAMETVAYEMATHVSLTATTPILNQSNERNATILDATGRLAALSVGIPQFMLSSTLPVRFALRGSLADLDLRVDEDETRRPRSAATRAS
jgi:N-methylhydantoinase B/oxoprolinase/acetone carboxylase alpha subunit